jgi:hypothetical protein
VARQLSTRPCTVAGTVCPAIATRACVGTNARSTLTSEPRTATAAFVEAAIGAPHRAAQHHDEMASGLRPEPVTSFAFGGPASATATSSATTDERYRGRLEEGVRAAVRNSSLFGES